MGATTVTIITGVIALAMVAVLVSQKANTANVLQGASNLASSIIGAAVSPVSGSQANNFGSIGLNMAGIPDSINVTPSPFFG